MQLSKVKPDLDSIQYFFDEHHHFHTTVDVYFSHQQQRLRAQLVFPFQRKGNFALEKIEVFYNEQWHDKKGNIEQYGLALAKHVMIVLLGNNIIEMEQTAKQQLEISFQHFVVTVSQRLVNLLKGVLEFECEASEDYLSLMTRMNLNGKVIAGKIATIVHFSNHVNVNVLAEEVAEKYKTEILVNVNKLQELQTEIGEDQTVYVTTVPIVNPVSSDRSNGRTLEVAVQSTGYCERCAKVLVSQMGTNVKINPLKLAEHKDDLLILIVGRTLQCDECGRLIKKEKVLLWEQQTEQLLDERLIDELMVLGQLQEYESIQMRLDAAVEHESYFYERAEPFWNAYTFVALTQWERFCQELTRIELIEGLRHFSDDLLVDSSKEMLLKRVERLVKSETDKRVFWRKANEIVISHYLRLTLFGWDLSKELLIIGEKRAGFIFQYLPFPEVLKPFYEKHADFFSLNATTDLKQQNIIEKQQQLIRQLQQENGILSEKLGSAYSRIEEMEKTSFMVVQENRNSKDVLKIQQLKGLIAELKEELVQLPTLEQADDVSKAEVILTEVSETNDIIQLEEIFDGKTILLLGGFRTKTSASEGTCKVLSHESRVLDPTFYEMLKRADIIVVLTRFISHRAMWEAKEFAILEEKEIYFSTYTNVATILNEIAKKMS
ncbi:DUF2325 domain-containing protein [Bacillus sp. DNRA2]|uniref:DUF2325 domain-containing protein n=1 Tax=Bacillus sp. DNRA2 TaxID=2723053 RepID=UPI00145CEC02|nr:DUF2325 domain-containing protein [Bacillus sp. DNRA2]NMD71029.1 DUF2325 domain-containing protein [Bacillus sp. DNRA2]